MSIFPKKVTYVRWGRILNLHSCNFADHGIKLRSLNNMQTLQLIFLQILLMFSLAKCQFVINGYTKSFEIIRWFDFISRNNYQEVSNLSINTDVSGV